MKFSYREALGALIWTATRTRPDIACTILNDGDVEHTKPDSHEVVGDHVR